MLLVALIVSSDGEFDLEAIRSSSPVASTISSARDSVPGLTPDRILSALSFSTSLSLTRSLPAGIGNLSKL